MQRRILHADLDAFFAAVEQARDPSLKGRPVVVGGAVGSRGVVAAASYEARPYGLRSGMPLATAYRLCPHAVFLAGDFSHYQQTSQRFMAILGDYSPDLEPLGLDEAYLDLTGFEPLYGPSRRTAQEIRRRVAEELGITASVGIACSKVVAKVASDFSKPDGLVEVPLGEERAFLSPLPIRQLPGVGPKMEQLLLGRSVRTIGQLANTPVADLKAWLGLMGEHLHRRANGLDSGFVALPPVAKSMSRETTFPQDTRDPSLLRATLYYLTERVAAELREQALQARCVSLKLRYSNFETLSRQRTLRHPTDAHQAIFAAALALLERILGGNRRGIRLIGVGISDFVDGGDQASLFEGGEGRQRSLNQALDKIRRKHGFAAIQAGYTLPLNGHFPLRRGQFVLHTPSLSR